MVCVGKGTKSSEFFMAQEKRYAGTLRLGEATPSYDAETEVQEVKPWEHLTDEDLAGVIEQHLSGQIMQVSTQLRAVRPCAGSTSVHCSLRMSYCMRHCLHTPR